MKVALVGGGATAEADFTMASVEQLAAVARAAGHEVIILACDHEIVRSAAWLETIMRCDVVFPLVSGLEGLFEGLGVAFVGSSPTAAGIAAHKGIFNDLLVSWNYSKTPYVRLTTAEIFDADAFAHLVFPLFVKPARLGASLGIVKVTEPDQLETAIATARVYDRELVVEQGVSGREVEVAVIAGKEIIVSAPGVIRLPAEYDWHDVESKEHAAIDVPGGAKWAHSGTVQTYFAGSDNPVRCVMCGPF